MDPCASPVTPVQDAAKPLAVGAPTSDNPFAPAPLKCSKLPADARGLESKVLESDISNPAQNGGFAEPLPPYNDATTSRPIRNGGNRATRVAMLDVLAPSPGFPYLIHLWEDFDNDHFLIHGPGSCSAAPVRFCRGMKACWNTTRAAQEYARREGENMPPSPPGVLGLGEKEHFFRFGKVYEWTRDWDFVLPVRSFPDSGERWMAEACLYFRGLSPHHCTIPWNDISKTERVEGDLLPAHSKKRWWKLKWMKFTWKFCEKSDYPRWAGSFTVYYQQGGKLAKGTSKYGVVTSLDNPWSFLSSDTTKAAEMHHRTGTGRFKKFMWYRQMLGYGNDVLDEPVEAWKKEHPVRYAEFASRFVPGSS